MPGTNTQKQLWEDTANKRSIPTPSSDRMWLDRKAMELQWPDEADGKIISDFLSATKGEKRIPHQFAKPEDSKLKNDLKSRGKAMQLHQLRSVAEIMHCAMSRIVTKVDSLELDDLQEILQLNVDAWLGITTLVNPLALAAIEETVECRLSLRDSTIPSKLKAAKIDLLALDPFCPDICGTSSNVEAVIKALPVPSQLTVPDKFFQSLKEAVKGNKPNPIRSYSNPSRFKRPTKTSSQSTRDQKPFTRKEEPRKTDSTPRPQPFLGYKGQSFKASGTINKGRGGKANHTPQRYKPQ